jgi:hypothetical protein
MDEMQAKADKAARKMEWRSTLILCHEVMQAAPDMQKTKEWIRNLRDDMVQRLMGFQTPLPADEQGSYFTLEEFKECVASGGFIDWDGTGYYATAWYETAIPCRPSDIAKGIVIDGYSHVTWYNK